MHPPRLRPGLARLPRDPGPAALGLPRPPPAPACSAPRCKVSTPRLSTRGPGLEPAVSGPRGAHGPPQRPAARRRPESPRQPLGRPGRRPPDAPHHNSALPPPAAAQRKSRLRAHIGRSLCMGGATVAADFPHWALPLPVSGARLLPGLCWDGFKVEKVQEGRVAWAREEIGCRFSSSCGAGCPDPS